MSVITEQLSQTGDVAGMPSNTIEGYAFRSGEAHWFDTSDCLCEVVDELQVHEIAGSAAWFAGLANFRGNLLPVTDLRLWLGLLPLQADPADTDNRHSLASSLASSGPLLIIEPHMHQSVEPTSPADDLPSSVERFAIRVDAVAGYQTVRANQINLVASTGSGNVRSAISADEALRRAALETSEPLHIASILNGVIAKPSDNESVQLVCNLSALIHNPVFKDIRNQHLLKVTGGVR